MATENRKVALQTELNADGIKEGVNQGKAALDDLARSAEQLGARAAKGLDGIGDSVKAQATETEAAAKRIDTATKSVATALRAAISQNQKGIAELETGSSSGSAFTDRLAVLKGADIGALEPLRNSLKQLESQFATLADRKREAASLADFEKQHASAKRLVQDAEYVRLWTTELEKMEAAERKAASNSAFIESLKKQSDAIGKTRVDLLEIQAAQAGLTSQAAPYIARLREQEKAYLSGGQALNSMGVSAKATAAALRQVPAQFTDIIVSLQGGQAPLTVLLQQGGQLKDVFGGVGNAARAMGGYIAGLISPLTILGATAAVAFVGFLKGASESQQFTRAIVLSGNAAGVTAGQLSDMARAIDLIGGGTQAKAAEVLADMAQSGRIGAENLQRFASAAIELERAGGPAAKETAKAFEDLAKSPLQASLKLNESVNFLTRSVIDQIKALEDQGLATDAARVAQEAYASVVETQAPQLADRLGLVQKVWRDIVASTKEAGDLIAGIGRAASNSERLGSLSEDIANARRGVERDAALPGFGSSRTAAKRQEGLDALLQEQAVLQENERLQRRSATAQGEAATQARLYGDYVKASASSLDRAAKLNAEITKTTVEGVKAGASRELIERNIAAIREKYKEKGASSVGNREEEARIDLLNKLAGLTSTYNEDIRRLNDLRKTGFLTEERYGEEVRKLVAVQPFAVKAARDIADATRDEARELANATRERERYLDGLEKQIDSQVKATQSAEEDILKLTQTKGALEELARLRLLDQASAAEYAARFSVTDDASAEAYRRLAVEIRKTAEARSKLGEAIELKDGQEAAAKAAKDAAQEWKRAADQIEQSLTDALLRGFESGKDFAKNLADTLKNMFSTLVLRPIISGIVQPVAGNITNLLGLGGQTGQSGATGAAGALQQAQSLYSQLTGLYSTVKDYGVSAASFFGGGATAGGAAASAGGGVSAGALLADGSGAAASSATAASSASYASIYAAIVIAASNAAARDFKNGFNQDSARNIGGALGPLAQTTTNLGDVLRKIGISNEAASILSGETLVSKLFGRGRATVEGRNIVGNIGGSGFDGTLDTRTRERGGVFRSDRVTTVSDALSGDIDRAIDETSAALRAQAKKYGEALGLPVAEIDSVVRAFNADVTFATQEEVVKRIQDELSKYGDSLLATFAPALEGVKNLGETTAQTIERVAGSLMGVNEVLKSIGVASLGTSVDGGKAALSLQELFGGLQGLQTASAAYFNEFFTAEQKQEQLRSQLTKTFSDINTTLPTTREGFKALVESQDLTTQAGRETFTTLLSVSGAFASLNPLLEDTAQAARSAADILSERKQLEKELLQAQGDTAGIRALERAAIDVSNRSLYDQINALEDQADAAKKAADAAEDLAQKQATLAQSITDAIGRFGTPEQKLARGFDTVSQSLAGVGVNIGADVLSTTAISEVEAFARAFLELSDVSIEAKIAVVDAASALFELAEQAKDVRRGVLESELERLAAEIGDINAAAVGPVFVPLSERLRAGQDALRSLEDGLATTLGNVAKTIQQTLGDLIASQRNLQNFRVGLADRIDAARLSGLSPEDRITALRNTEARLFAELGTTDDPAAVAGRLQDVILDRIKAEADITVDLRNTQIDALREQIDGYKELSGLAKELAQFTGSLRSSDLSSLSFEDQLKASKALFDSTLTGARSGDADAQRSLSGNARAYLEEARQFFGSSAAYADIFAQVTASLDTLGATAPGETQIKSLQAQLDALTKLNENAEGGSSATIVAELSTLSAAIVARETKNDADIAAQTARAEAEIQQRRDVLTALDAQITQAAEGYRQLLARLDTLNGSVNRLVGNSDLDVVSPA